MIIAAAGLAAHLPGVIASHTTLPVIGIPLKGGSLLGMDALLSMVQMPKGVPVATVGIDASRNACILACEILSIKYDGIRKKLEEMKERMRQEIDDKSRESAVRGRVSVQRHHRHRGHPGRPRVRFRGLHRAARSFFSTGARPAGSTSGEVRQGPGR